jgi:hypothetical protein
MTQGAPDDVGSVRALLFDLGGVVIELDFKQAFRVWAERASRDPAELADDSGSMRHTSNTNEEILTLPPTSPRCGGTLASASPTMTSSPVGMTST